MCFFVSKKTRCQLWQQPNLERGRNLQDSGESAQRFLHSYFHFCKNACGVTPSKCFLVSQQIFRMEKGMGFVLGIRNGSIWWSRTPSYCHASGSGVLVRKGDKKFHAQ